ncbi:MAG: 30S ribosomal protein S5 [Candidatus Margulisiibacteriota bacterium]
MTEELEKVPEIKEKVIQVTRVTKVVKGGKKMGFRATVAVGDLKSKVGLGIGKAAEVSAAIRKGVEAAKKAMREVVSIGGTIPHEVIGKFLASKVVLRPAPRGTGIIAGGTVRTILELAGYKNCVAKSIGSSNAINVARATLKALDSLKRLEVVAQQRGKTPKVYYVATE